MLPPKVEFPFRQQAYVALAPNRAQSTRLDRDLQLFGRLAPGVSIEQARADVRAIAARLGAVHAEDAEWGALVRPLRDYFAPDEVKLVTVAALGAVTLVLLIACSNVASLLLARASVPAAASRPTASATRSRSRDRPGPGRSRAASSASGKAS